MGRRRSVERRGIDWREEGLQSRKKYAIGKDCLKFPTAIDDASREDLRSPDAVTAYAERDPPARQIVGRNFHLHAVTRNNANEVFTHLPGDVGNHLAADVQFH